MVVLNNRNPVDRPHSDSFNEGMNHLKNYSIHRAKEYFQLAYESVSKNDSNHNKYESYCGLSRVLTGDRGGIELCRDAVRSEKRDADVYLNLACVEWLFKRRRNSVMALEKGLKIDKRHPGLKNMRKQIGYRQTNVIPFLSRTNILNELFGKLRRKKTEDKSHWDLPHVF